MGDARFDALVRALAGARSRRGLLRLLAGAAISGSLAPRRPVASAPAAPASPFAPPPCDVARCHRVA